jgi:hypothetical protein
MAPLPALLTALDLIRAAEAVGLGRITGPALDRARGLDLDRIRGLGLVPTMARVPITAQVLDRRPARLALLPVLLHLAAIRLSNTESSASLIYFAKAIVGLRPSFSSHVRFALSRGTRPVSFRRGLGWKVRDLGQWYPTSRK